MMIDKPEIRNPSTASFSASVYVNRIPIITLLLFQETFVKNSSGIVREYKDRNNTNNYTEEFCSQFGQYDWQ